MSQRKYIIHISLNFIRFILSYIMLYVIVLMNDIGSGIPNFIFFPKMSLKRMCIPKNTCNRKN